MKIIPLLSFLLYLILIFGVSPKLNNTWHPDIYKSDIKGPSHIFYVKSSEYDYSNSLILHVFDTYDVCYSK